jgi:NitT/TauT family transport system permease protein
MIIYIYLWHGLRHGVVWSLMTVLLALAATFIRMGAALVVTVAVAYAVGYAMYKSRRIEAVALPILDVLQSVPILGFFPLALYVFIALLPAVGAELAAVFLIFTSMAWNLIFGVYQSLKTLPREYAEYARLYLNERLSLGHVYVPAALRSVYYNVLISWANAFFFITASEVITLGTEVKLFGIGSLVVSAFESNDYATAYMGIVAGVLANLALYVFVLRRLVEEVPQPPAYLLEKLRHLGETRLLRSSRRRGSVSGVGDLLRLAVAHLGARPGRSLARVRQLSAGLSAHLCQSVNCARDLRGVGSADACGCGEEA